MSSTWTWLLTAISIVGLWGTAGSRRWGWALNLAGQPPWLAYALLTHQPGFLVSGAAFTVIFARNLVLAHRTQRRHSLPLSWRAPQMSDGRPARYAEPAARAQWSYLRPRSAVRRRGGLLAAFQCWVLKGTLPGRARRR